MKALQSAVRGRWLWPFQLSIIIGLTSLLLPCPTWSHAGHDHGPVTTLDVRLDPRAEAHSDQTEMTVVLEAPRLLIYLDDFATNTPILGAEVLVEMSTPDGLAEFQAVDEGEGVYSLEAPWLAESGRHALMVSIQDGRRFDLLTAALQVPEDEADEIPTGRSKPAPSGVNMPSRLADGSLSLPKPAQRLYGVRTAQATLTQVGETHELLGEVVADPSASGLVQAPKIGRLHSAADGLPVLGQVVEEGALLAWLEPLPTSLERANQEAFLADLEGQIALSRQRIERLAVLDTSAPRQEIEDVTLQLVSQEARREALARGLDERLPLRAPVSGVVSHTKLRAGAIVDEHEALLELVDPKRLQVTAYLYDPALADQITTASARTAKGEAVSLQLIGTGYRLEAQALPLQFEIVGEAPRLALGQTLTVMIETRAQTHGVVLPRAAVVRQGGGASQVWVHPTAERFKPRLVQLKPFDAERILVVKGLEPGERVVTAGAALLNQIR